VSAVCNAQCIEFVRAGLTRQDVEGRRVLEVGALVVNGSVRPAVEVLGPASYVGVDLAAGPGVDRICAAERLVAEFGPASFDVVVSTEMIEHVVDWREVIHNLKRVVTPGGVIMVTTRSPGFPFHGFPDDHWRFDAKDMRVIFADGSIELLEHDRPEDPGIFVKVRMPLELDELDLEGYALHSMAAGRRVTSVDEAHRLGILERAASEAQEELGRERTRGAADLARAQSDLQRVYATKTFVYSAALRHAYGKLRHRRGCA
jgi:SAM-dependent methyltransferase